MVDSSSPSARHVTKNLRYPRLLLCIPRCLTPSTSHPYALISPTKFPISTNHSYASRRRSIGVHWVLLEDTLGGIDESCSIVMLGGFDQPLKCGGSGFLLVLLFAMAVFDSKRAVMQLFSFFSFLPLHSLSLLIRMLHTL